MPTLPGSGLLLAGPKTARFLTSELVRRRWRLDPSLDIPAVRPTLGFATQVAIDEALIGLMGGRRRNLSQAECERIAADLSAARDLYASRGWLADPRSYHRTPGVPAGVSSVRRTARGLGYDHVRWDSGYTPYKAEPGATGWARYRANTTAHAYLVHAPEPTDAWLVCVHGFGMGTPLIDLHIFRARRLAEEIGCNLAFPVLPLHGPRKQGRMSGSELMSLELMNLIFGLSQSVWDVRSLVTWLQRERGARRFGLYGISLGAYNAALVAGIDERFDTIIAGIPTCDFPRLFQTHMPRTAQRRALAAGALGAVADDAFRVVSPLAVDSHVPRERRFILAATGDRMSRPRQATQLWEHWGRPAITWLNCAHAGCIAMSAREKFVLDALDACGW